MGSYTIGQIAGRSGFSASALRYYEDIGLVPPAGRNPAGYRLYDDDTLHRLAFVARAKQLGCTLEEISELVDLWHGDRCEPVQRRLHQLVTTKLDDTQRRLAELAMFTAELRAAAARLGTDPVDGPCDDGCACLAAREPAAPVACTLGAGELPGRVADWQRLLATAGGRATLPSGGVRVELDAATDLGELARLVAAEQACCAFLRFAITVDGRGTGLEVEAPAEAGEVVAELFGAPA